MNLVGIFYHHRQNLPIVMNLSDVSKFLDLCEAFPTSWAFLCDQDTGKLLDTYHTSENTKCDQYHPLVKEILYGDVDEIPWDVIKDECLLDENGNVDVNWANKLDEEQYLRVAIAATVQKWFNKNLGI